LRGGRIRTEIIGLPVARGSEIAVARRFLEGHGLRDGDRITVEYGPWEPNVAGVRVIRADRTVASVGAQPRRRRVDDSRVRRHVWQTSAIVAKVPRRAGEWKEDAGIEAGTMLLERPGVALFEADEGGGARFVPAPRSYRPPTCA
jgi:hypothetical protein